MVTNQNLVPIETFNLADAAIQHLKETLPRHRAECEEQGHLDVDWTPYLINDRSSHKDKAYGVCAHCLSEVERSLNGKEHAAIDRFYQSLHTTYVP
jgi:hypothetical protein